MLLNIIRPVCVSLVCLLLLMNNPAMAGRTQRVSVSSAGNQANADAHFTVSVSADGNRVAFATAADNLTAGDTNGRSDIFLRDRSGSVLAPEIGITGNGLEIADGDLLTFAPTGTGLRTASVTIDNSDSDEGAYTFAVQGTGLAPEIVLSHDATPIANADQIDAGFTPDQPGAYVFQLTVSDGLAFGSQRVTMDVSPAATPAAGSGGGSGSGCFISAATVR